MRIALLFFVLLLIGNPLFSQVSSKKDSLRTSQEEIPSFKDKCYVGGDVLFFLDGTGSLFNLSPMFGYRPQNKNFSYGVGATYQYTSFRDFTTNYKFSNHLLGGRVFARQLLGSLFFLHAEAEMYFTQKENFLTNKVEWVSIPFANAFLGYKSRFSNYSYYYFMLGYNVLENPNGYYVYPTNPILFKAGYIFDLGGK
jgi:hypothetical protein